MKQAGRFTLNDFAVAGVGARDRAVINRQQKGHSTVNNKMDERQLDSFDWEKAADQLTPGSVTTVSTDEAIAHTDQHFDAHVDGHADKPLLC